MCNLKKVLDAKNYRKLVKHYGGCRIWVPKDGNPGHRERTYFDERDEKIYRLFKQGTSVKELGEMFGLTDRGVYSVLYRKKCCAQSA